MIKVIIFDVDGVLINGKRFVDTLYKECGISPKMTKAFFSGPFQDCLLGNADLKKELPKYLKQWGWEKGVEEFMNYWFVSEHTINEPLIKYIQQLRNKGMKCMLATNQESYRVSYIMKEMGFANTFDAFHASSSLGSKKPNSDFYNSLFTQLKDVQKNEVLFWDDTKINVDAAKSFGIHAELYLSFSDFKKKMEAYL